MYTFFRYKKNISYFYTNTSNNLNTQNTFIIQSNPFKSAYIDNYASPNNTIHNYTYFFEVNRSCAIINLTLPYLFHIFVKRSYDAIYKNFFYTQFLPKNFYIYLVEGILFKANITPLLYLVQIILWQVPVPKHRFLFLFIRKFCKKLYFFGSSHLLLKSVGFFFKGKLSVTGNKRTRTFCGN